MSRVFAMLLALRTQPALPPEGPASPSAIHWDAPASCPTQGDVEARIAARVALDQLRVRARVVATADGFAADVAIESAYGSSARSLASPSCESVVDAVVLLAHVAAEPLPTHDRIAPPAPVAAPEVPEPVAIDPTAADASATPTIAPKPLPREPDERPPLRLRATIGASAIVGGGTLPRIDAGVLGAVGIASRIGRAEVGALYLAPQRADLDIDADAGVVVDAWGVALRVCPALPLRTAKIELSICAAATAGRLRGTSSGDDLSRAGTRGQPWLRLAGGPELAIAVHPRVRLLAAIEGGGHVVAPGFVIGVDRVWAPKPWAVHGLAGLQVRLP